MTDSIVIPTRQKVGILWDPALVVLQAPGATLTLPPAEVDGYQSVAFLVISDQPFQVVVQESIFPDGPYLTTATFPSSLDAGSGSQKVAMRVSPSGSFMRILITNTGSVTQAMLQLGALGYPSSGTASSGAGAPTTSPFVLAVADAALPNARIITAGANITIADGGPGGQLVISATGGGGGAPTTSEYILLSADAALPNSRVITAGAGISFADGGPGGPLTISSSGSDATAWHNTGDNYGPGAIFGTTGNNDITFVTNGHTRAIWTSGGANDTATAATLYLGANIGPYDPLDPEQFNINGNHDGSVRMFIYNTSAGGNAVASYLLQNSTGANPPNGGMQIMGSGWNANPTYAPSELVVYAGGFSPGLNLGGGGANAGKYVRFTFENGSPNEGEWGRVQWQTNGIPALMIGTTSSTFLADIVVNRNVNANVGIRIENTTNGNGQVCGSEYLLVGVAGQQAEFILTSPAAAVAAPYQQDQVAIITLNVTNGINIGTRDGAPVMLNPGGTPQGKVLIRATAETAFNEDIRLNGATYIDGPTVFADGTGNEWGRIVATGSTPASTLLVGETTFGPSFRSWIEVGGDRDAPNYVTVGNGSNTSGASAAYNLWYTDAAYAQLFIEPPNGFSGSGIEADQMSVYAQGFANGISIHVHDNHPLKLKTNATTRVTVDGDGGVTVGAAPTGGSQGAGTINVAGDIYKNGSAYTNPDYVLEHWATGEISKFSRNKGAKGYVGRMSLDEVETYCRKNFRLPGIDDGAMGVFDRSDFLLARLEEIYTYLFDLRKGILSGASK